MTQDEINQSEWSNPQNWTGPGWCKLYSSRRDGRVWVPKRHRALGWTVNIGHPKGAVCFAAVVIAAIGFVVLANILVMNLVVKK